MAKYHTALPIFAICLLATALFTAVRSDAQTASDTERSGQRGSGTNWETDVKNDATRPPGELSAEDATLIGQVDDYFN
ncbi:MAG: hypothetical protein ACR2OX_10025, partial [Methyloligellaceae bacterium]